MTNALEPVELRTRRANDWLLTILCSMFSLLMVYAIATESATAWEAAPDLAAQGLYVPLERLIGVPGVRLFAAAIALTVALNALAAAWRLRDGGLVLRADEHGLMFHPSLCAGSLNWSDVESVKLDSQRPAKIKIRLRKRFWSFTHPFTSRDIKLNLVAIGSTHSAAQATVRAMKRLLSS